jgi:hypothetical protein
VFCTLGKDGPFFIVETTITDIMHLDVLRQFFSQQLDEDDQESHIQQDGAPLITSEKRASTSTPISQVSGLVEWHR